MARISADQIKEKWLAIRKEAGRKIDPETAEVMWAYAQTLDPYGVDPELPEELWQVGRAYFARSPKSDIWVWFGDLPDGTGDRLWKRHKRELAFPAGLSPS
jgi:hypothetical protein